MPSSGPTQGAGSSNAAQGRWQSYPGLATALRAAIFVAPMVMSLAFTWLAATVAPPEDIGVNRWLWILLVFALANIVLAVVRRLVHNLTPLVALMQLTLVFPDQAPSRAKATLRRSSSRSMLRQIEEATARGDESPEVLYGDYLVQLLAELNEHDRLTRGHSERVKAYSEMLGEEIELGADDMNKLRWAALLHDVGKLDVPSEILNKPGRPTEEEWQVLSAHPQAANRMLAPLQDWLGDWAHAADQHHCRWDGTGYPYGLAGEDISLAGRIVAVADAYDVMTSARSYKKPLPAEVARQELTDCAGTQFDPALVRAFLNVSLGRLATVAGPFGWLANFIASAQVKIPIATSISSGVTSATAMVAVAAGGVLPDEPPAELAMTGPPPAVEAVDSQAGGDEDEQILVTLTARGGDGEVTFRVGSPSFGDAAIVDEPTRRSNEPPSLPGVTAMVTWERSAVYRPVRDFNGSDSFAVEACDTTGRCSSATVRVEVLPVNDPPAANRDRVFTEPGAAIEIDALINDTDDGGQPLEIIEVSAPAGGEAILASGRIVYVPDPGFVGDDEIRYTVVDTDGARSTGVIIVTVTALPPVEPSATIPPTPAPSTSTPTTTSPSTSVSTSVPASAPPVKPPPNQPPSATDDTATIDEDTFVLIDVLANDVDVDGDTLTVTGLGEPSHGAAALQDGRVRYQPDADYHGPDSVLYVVSDGTNPQVVATISIEVTSVNDEPAITALSSVTISEMAAVGSTVVDLTVTDADGDPLTVSIESGDPSGVFIVDGDGAVSLASAVDHETTASYLLNFEATDGQVVTSHLTAVSIADVNEPPEAGADGGPAFSTDEDVPLTTGDVTANDNDVDDPIDPSSLTVGTNPTNGTLTYNGDGTFNYTPDVNWSGTDTFTYTVTDGGGLDSNPAAVTIVVDAVNDAPAVTNPGTRRAAEQMPFSLPITATDVEGHNMAYSVSGLPSGLGINSAGLISGTPNPGTNGSYSVDVTVTDAGPVPAAATVSLTLDVGYHEVSTQAGDVVINEVLYNTVSAVAPEEFIELHNPTGTAVDLTGWVLADANLKATGPADLTYTVPATDHWGAASDLPAGGYAVIWLAYDGTNLPPLANPTGGLEYVVNVAGAKLDDAGDDLWLLDQTTAIVDYLAYGSGVGVGTPPEAVLGLWDDTHQAALSTGAANSIQVSPNGSDGDDSGCWEPTGSGDAAGRCLGAGPTINSHPIGSIATSLFKDNNAAMADAGGPYAIAEGDALVLDGSGSVGASNWNWDLDNDGNYDDATTSGPSIPWATLSGLGVDDDGAYPIGVEVNGGDTDTATLTISNTVPTLIASGTESVADGGTYTLNLSVADPGDDTVSQWVINWGDGAIQTVAGNPSSVDHVYTGAGLTYNILVSATDEDGTVHQNELVVPGYLSDELYWFGPTDGALVRDVPTVSKPIETLIGPDGNLYVSSEDGLEVSRYNPTTGAFIDQFVTTGSGGLTEVGGMAFGPDGNLYVSDYGGNQVLRFNGSTGAYIDVFAIAGLDRPYDLIFGPDNNLYVGEYAGDRVRRFDGTLGTALGLFITTGNGLAAPEQMAFGPDGNFYIASSGSDEVLRYNGSTGAFIDVFVSSGGAGGLDRPAGLVFGPDGHLYVSDLQDNVVIRFDGSTGAFIDNFTVAGAGGADEPAMMTFIPQHQVTVTP